MGSVLDSMAARELKGFFEISCEDRNKIEMTWKKGVKKEAAPTIS